MVIIVLFIAAVIAFVGVFGKMLIEITNEVDKRHREEQKEREFQRHLQESIRKGQRRN